MSADDDTTDCAHRWRLVGIALIPGNGATEYVCEGCAAVLYCGPNDVMPDTT